MTFNICFLEDSACRGCSAGLREEMNCMWGGLVSASALDIAEQSKERSRIQSPEGLATDLVAR